MFLATGPDHLGSATGPHPARRVARRSETPAWRVHAPGDPDRPAVESFIREVYRRRFGAVVRRFMPVLIGVYEDDALVAAAGYRLGSQPLFLERYLDRPVDAMLLDHGATVLRPAIAEVGHLAATRGGEGRQLIRRLGPHLARQNVQWVVSTLTQELHHLFERMGVRPLRLGDARPQCLGPEAADWGSYYDHHPQVFAGNLPQALQRLGIDGVKA
jgi:hypothetical protein